MQLGQWVRLMRKERSLDLRDMAARTGVDATTISRIERGSQATLTTVMRLCEGLDISLADLLFTLEGRHFAHVEHLHQNTGEIMPTLKDIHVFLSSFHTDVLPMRAWLASLLNKIAVLARTEDRHTQQLFVPEDIEKLLLPSPLYQFVLQYPLSLPTEAIVDIQMNGGILLWIDIGMFVRKARQSKQVTLAGIEDATQLSTSVLSRLEAGSLGRIKFHDVLMLDTQLAQEGMILAMYWNACSVEDTILRHYSPKSDHTSSSWIQQEMKVVTLFTLICRWFQALSPDASWVQELRHHSQQHV